MRIATTACLVGVCALFAQTAHAQDEASTELSASTEVAEETAEDSEAEPAENEEEEDDGEKKEAMNSFGIGLKLGVGMILGQEVTSASTTGTTAIGVDKQNDAGLALGIPIYLGDGHGFGTDLEIFHWRHKENGFKLNYTGLQVALGARFQITDPIYMFIGLGPRLGVVHGDVDVGVHAAMRLPVQVTWYPIDMLGIVGELGLGYGGTGRTRVNVTGGESSAEFISGFLMDLTVGVRFP